jgi:hypothetical protein
MGCGLANPGRGLSECGRSLCCSLALICWLIRSVVQDLCEDITPHLRYQVVWICRTISRQNPDGYCSRHVRQQRFG